jgi:hypothetical protein
LADIWISGHTTSKRKTKSGRHQLNMAEELKDVINDYSKNRIRKQRSSVKIKQPIF